MFRVLACFLLTLAMLGPARAAPAGAAAVPDAVIALATNGEACRLPDGETAASMTQSAELDSDTKIYLVPCPSSRENILYRTVMAYPGDDMDEGPRRLVLKQFANFNHAVGWHAISYLSNVELDAATGRLTQLNRLDLTGDCGTRTIWLWNLESGFVMQELRHQPVCDTGSKPDEWPLIYTSETSMSEQP